MQDSRVQITSRLVVWFALPVAMDTPVIQHHTDVNYYADNSCPSDLNEDGTVGFEDLLQVLSDVAGFRYHPQTNNGFNALLKVLSEWGDCDA